MLVSGIIFIPARLLDILYGVDSSSPMWFKVVSMCALVAESWFLLAVWRGKRWGIGGCLCTTTAYWLAHTMYRGFSVGSLMIYIGMTFFFLILVYRELHRQTQGITTAE
jgi:hypothetical protein